MERFQEACGATGPLVLLVESPGAPGAARHVLHQPFAVLGRAAQADVVLDDPQVSQRHAYLQLVGGRLFCVDLDSRAGIHWPDGPRRSGWLGPGQVLAIGPFRVRWVRGGPEDEPPAASPLVRGALAADSLPGLTLEFPTKVVSRWRPNRLVTLAGRSAECKLHLDDEAVSRYHASLLLTPAGAWVIDLLSRGGVLVNGTRVRWRRLEHGDDLRLGRFPMRACYEKGPEANALVPAPAEDSVTRSAFRAREPVSVPSLVLPAPAAAGEPSRAPVVVQANGRSLRETSAGGPVAVTPALPAPVLEQFGLMQQQMLDEFRQMGLMLFQLFGELHREEMEAVHGELRLLRQLTQELTQLRTELLSLPAEEPRQPAGVAGQRPATPEPAAEPSRQEPTPPRAAKPDAQGPPPTQEVHAWLCERIATLQQERQGHWQKLLNFLAGKQPPGKPAP
jgi:pSer/pThr/pTyr-binding forkhead associated (FHA) protein